MLTEDQYKVEYADKVSCKFANIMYNKMCSVRYGVKPCNACGDNDIIGGENIHIIEWKKLKLSQMSDCKDIQSNEKWQLGRKTDGMCWS